MQQKNLFDFSAPPWEVTQLVSSNDQKLNTILITSSDGKEICKIIPEHYDFDAYTLVEKKEFSKEDHCNANLIAALPDLLEALLLFTTSGEGPAEAHTKANEALYKAFQYLLTTPNPHDNATEEETK